MSIKLQIQLALIMLAVVGGMRCDPVTALDPLPKTPFFDNFIYSLNWCDCNYLAVGGQWEDDDNPGSLGIFQFDQSTQTLSLALTTSFFGAAFSVKWCPASTCQYLAVGGTDNTNGQIQIYQFEQSMPMLNPILGANQQLGGSVNSIDWCPSCSYLAAGDDLGDIQLYYFDGFNLTPTFAPIPPLGSSINSLEWCGDCQYLAAVDNMSTLYIYSFDSHAGLIPVASYTSTSTYYSIDWCGDCGYIAAGGQDNINRLGVVDIYKFDPSSTPSLQLVATTEIQGSSRSSISSVAWCQGCENLAVVGARFLAGVLGSLSFMQLYHFGSSGTLSFVNEYPLAYDVFLGAVGWCADCSYLAVEGFNESLGEGIVQLFKSEFFVPTPTNLTAQKICHRFATQTDIINKLCWDAVPGAVMYKVYDNEDVTAALAKESSSQRGVTAFNFQQGQQTYTDVQVQMLLATITNQTLCYSQHQICNGKSTTYYVTAVDEHGSESEPAVVTI